MERLTTRIATGQVYIPYCDYQMCDGICSLCDYEDKILEKLVDYEDLEEKLEKVYGKCEGLLETAVNSLVKHEGAEIGTPAKARLLTDEDVDKWLAWKDAEEQGLLPRFHLGDEFWTIRLGKVLKAKVVMLQQKKDGSWQYRFSQEITPEYHDTHNYKESEFGKCFFLTKEEAEQALAKMKEV